jgi:hypothetical protein
LWAHRLGGKEDADLAIDEQNSLYVLQNYNWPFSPAIAEVNKFDAGGNQQWSRPFPSGWDAVPETIAVDAEGNVYVAGTADDALPGQSSTGYGDVFVLKFTP